MTHTMLRLLFACCVLLESSLGLIAQTPSGEPFVPVSTAEEAYCESNLSELGILNQNVSSSDLIIIVSYSGVGENERIGSRRLFNAKTMFVSGFKSEFNRKPEMVIVSKGEASSARGYLDFFASGRLQLRIFFKKNADLILGPCAIDFPYEKPCEDDFARMFYPCKKR